MLNIKHLRKNYKLDSLELNDLDPHPYIQFQKWFAQAQEAGIVEPNAMVLATASLEGKPSSRTVLLKGIDEGFFFFTNQKSRKASELEQNPYASATFLWKDLERQVILEGSVKPMNREEVDLYFAERPRGSQIASWISPQGRIIGSRKELDDQYQELEIKFEGKNIPLPPHWGGYRIFPTRIEFWQGRENRLHDRFQYVCEDDNWIIQRLAP